MERFNRHLDPLPRPCDPPRVPIRMLTTIIATAGVALTTNKVVIVVSLSITFTLLNSGRQEGLDGLRLN